MFAKCADDLEVSELLQIFFIRIKTAKQITAIIRKSRAKKLKNKTKKTATTIIKKERLIKCRICVSKA